MLESYYYHGCSWWGLPLDFVATGVSSISISWSAIFPALNETFSHFDPDLYYQKPLAGSDQGSLSIISLRRRFLLTIQLQMNIHFFFCKITINRKGPYSSITYQLPHYLHLPLNVYTWCTCGTTSMFTGTRTNVSYV